MSGSGSQTCFKKKSKFCRRAISKIKLIKYAEFFCVLQYVPESLTQCLLSWLFFMGHLGEKRRKAYLDPRVFFLTTKINFRF